jgi:hypothetical protein
VRYRVTAYCGDPDCNCDDSRGVILYDGYDLLEAAAAAENLTPDGYEVDTAEVEEG